jgi:hypothetical protein
MREHTVQGARSILNAPSLTPARARCALVALTHHTEYSPVPKASTDLYTSIVAIADAYDAMVGPRPHHEPRTPQQALEEILADPGRDASLARMFMNMMGTYPPGSIVRLDGGEACMVIGRPLFSHLNRPQVKVLVSRPGLAPARAVVDTAERAPDGRFIRKIDAILDAGQGFGPADLAALW